MKNLVKLLLIFCATSTYAVPINITADTVTIQEIGVSIYRGNARLTQKDNSFTADKIIVSHDKNKLKKVQVVGSLKKPARMIFVDNDTKEKIEASAVRIDYDIESELITLKQNAKLKQAGNLIEATKIEFNRKTKKISAKSEGQSQVNTQFNATDKKQ